MPSGNQRWRGRRDSYRLPDEIINTRLYEVAPIPEREAKAFVSAHHYSGTYPAARFRFGLYRGAELVGVAVFSHPCSDRVLTNVFPGDARDSVELGRFVLLDSVPGNGETWFLARTFELLRGAVRGVVSFSDPCPRLDAEGRTVFPGHYGTIYQAHNGVFLGRGEGRTLRLLPDGRVFSHRAEQKIKSLERGWEYSATVLERAGAEPLRGDPRVWLATWLPRLTRKVRHPGCLKYAWALERRVKRFLPPSKPYPKREAV